MKKQMLAVVIGLSVFLGGCSAQSTDNMLQEVKKETKEIKSGKVKLETSINSDRMSDSRGSGFTLEGDEKFDPTEILLKGKFVVLGMNIDMEHYMKDGVYYTKNSYSGKPVWHKKEAPKDDANGLNFKTISLNMDNEVLGYLDNKDNWDLSVDGDMITFKLKKNDDIKNKLKELYKKKVNKNENYGDFDYNVEYVYDKKAKKVVKLFFETNAKQDTLDVRTKMKGTLEELNKEVKVDVPEESKTATEMKLSTNESK